MDQLCTKKGDNGWTDDGFGQRLLKDEPLVEFYGSLDELSAGISILLTKGPFEERISKFLLDLPLQLIELGTMLQPIEPNKKIITGALASVEEHMAYFMNHSFPKGFMFPTRESAVYCNFARTQCRRAERKLVALSRSKVVPPIMIQYLNRLSDLLFVITLDMNRID